MWPFLTDTNGTDVIIDAPVHVYSDWYEQISWLLPSRNMPDKDEKSATTPKGTARWSLRQNAPTLHAVTLGFTNKLMYM